MTQRCLLIADDLTGGADSGAQFAKRGLSTLLVSIMDVPSVDFSKYNDRDVLVVNTDSRGVSPEKAFSLISGLLKNYDRRIFPIIYKKIDSTLRGNIGYEIHAILNKTEGSICFFAPSYPEQNRTLVSGILMVNGKPLALTEVANDAASPVEESDVHKILEKQSLDHIGRVDLTFVASNHELLQKAIDEERGKGIQIIIFDAVTRQDLTHIAEAAFEMERIPLLVGSAGLAEEVANMISPSKRERMTKGFEQRGHLFEHIFIISGSASSVTHRQLERIKETKIPVFQLNPSFILRNERKVQTEERNLSLQIAHSLSKGPVVLKTFAEKIASQDARDLPVHLKITKTLASLSRMVLEQSKIDVDHLVLVLAGGDTAMSVLNILRPEGIEIEGELLEGIVSGHLVGGDWDGLTIVTKAGAFGKEDALIKIVKILETGG